MWVWEYPAEDDDGQPTSHDLFMDPGEEIRFRVTGETFVDCSPNAPDPSKPNQLDQVNDNCLLPIQEAMNNNVILLLQVDSTSTGGGVMGGDIDPSDKRIPFQLHASINEPGLGLLSWWKSD